MESHLGFYSAFPDIGNYFPISGIGIPDIGKSISDIGKWSIFRYREMIFGYRKLIFRYREMCLISRYREINSRYPKIATRQKQVTPPPCNTALPHRPLSRLVPLPVGWFRCLPPFLRLTYRRSDRGPVLPPINNGPQLYQSHLLVDLYGPTYTTSVNRSVQPTIIIQPMISLKNAHEKFVVLN